MEGYLQINLKWQIREDILEAMTPDQCVEGCAGLVQEKTGSRRTFWARGRAYSWR